MYASVRTYRTDAAKIDEMLHTVDEMFAPRISSMAGFCGYQVVDGGDGRLVTISCFETMEQAEASNDKAAEFVRDELADYEIERLDAISGDVRVSVETEKILQEAHV